MIFDFSFCGMFSSSRFSTLDMRFGMVRTVAKTGPSVDLTPNYSRWVLLFVLTLFSRIEVLSQSDLSGQSGSVRSKLGTKNETSRYQNTLIGSRQNGERG